MPELGYLDTIRRFAEADFGNVYVQQVGPDQDGSFRFYEREVLPRAGRLAVTETA